MDHHQLAVAAITPGQPGRGRGRASVRRRAASLSSARSAPTCAPAAAWCSALRRCASSTASASAPSDSRYAAHSACLRGHRQELKAIVHTIWKTRSMNEIAIPCSVGRGCLTTAPSDSRHVAHLACLQTSRSRNGDSITRALSTARGTAAGHHAQRGSGRHARRGAGQRAPCQPAGAAAHAAPSAMSTAVPAPSASCPCTSSCKQPNPIG
jgi:hypothetical protein